MKRITIVVMFSLIALVAQAQTKSAGGAISIFLPENLYLYGNGTPGFEQGLSTSFGFGDVISFPIGFAYHAADGFSLSHKDAKSVALPVLYGDSFIPSLMLKAHVALGSVFYLEAFGGGALDWAFSLKPTAEFARTMASSDTEKVALDGVTITKGIGYGWVAGGALGVKFGAISVDLGGTYRWLNIPVTIESDIVRVSGANATPAKVKFADAFAVLKGVSVQLGGSYAF